MRRRFSSAFNMFVMQYGGNHVNDSGNHVTDWSNNVTDWSYHVTDWSNHVTAQLTHSIEYSNQPVGDMPCFLCLTFTCVDILF